MLEGTPYPTPTMAEADAEFLNMEAAYVDRAPVLKLLETNFESYCRFLDSLEPSRLDDLVRLPFELGHAPMRFAIRAGAQHTQSHASQLEYLQTIYGDRVW